jgi:hypothetical protein
MLIIDHLAQPDLSIDDMIETVLPTVAQGLTARPGPARLRRRPKRPQK